MVRHNWAEERIYFEESDGRLRMIPVGWTSLVDPDPVIAVGGGRSAFRATDLVKLAVLMKQIRKLSQPDGENGV